MGKFNLASMAKSIRAGAIKHSPEILVGLGVSGMIATAVLAATATPKALKLIANRAEEEDCAVEDLTTGEKVKACWKCYIPAAVTGITSAACIIGAHSVDARRNAALAAAYALSDSTLREYKAKVVEVVGEKKEQTIREKVAEEKLKKNPINSSEVIVTGTGTTRCYDDFAGRYFESDIDKIKNAAINLNYQLLNSMYVSLNDFYDELGLEHTKLGDLVGWRVDRGKVDISFSAHLASDGKPCLVLEYNVEPEYDYDRLA